ncbi:MAG: prepilin-type N-terminal cleavage/methylation domain-containing protein [Phycisphaerales bacterium]
MIPRNQPIAVRLARRGFTLLELIVSTAVMSVLMVALGSVMLIAGRAVPQAQSVTGTMSAAAAAAEQMASELRYAAAVNQQSSTMIEFTVADRNSDGLPETIRYEWAGTSGASLTRQYNAGTAVAVLPDVREFALTYDTEVLSKEIPQGNESAETRLLLYTSSWDYGDYPIRDTERYAEYFFPPLPADAVSWKVTRVKFLARGSGVLESGTVDVQLQLPTAGNMPSGVVVDQSILYEPILPLTYVLCEMPFTKATNLSPSQGLCLVFNWLSGYTACELQGRTEDVTATNIALVRTVDRGASWYTLTRQSLLFSVYGKVTTAGTPQTQNVYYLNGVRIQLRAGADSRSLVQTAVKVLNRPEVSL